MWLTPGKVPFATSCEVDPRNCGRHGIEYDWLFCVASEDQNAIVTSNKDPYIQSLSGLSIRVCRCLTLQVLKFL